MILFLIFWVSISQDRKNIHLFIKDFFFRLLMVMPTSTLYSSLNLFLAMVVASTAGVVQGGEASTGNGNKLVLPQR
jgi:hypothetical protein